MTETVTQRSRAAGSDFAALNRQITKAGLLERRPAYYAIRMSVVAAMLVRQPPFVIMAGVLG
jgi:hypothetical protein